MAAPVTTTDLTNITLAESITSWTALGGGASGLGVGADFAMQGPLCVDKQVTAAEKGQIFDFGSTIATGSDRHFYTWIFLATPGLSNTLAARGLAVVMGTTTTAYTQFHVEGRDTYGAVGRVAKCYPVRYSNVTSSTPPYRTLVGAPGANPQWFGGTTNITGTVKGANLGTDAIRYGTGIYVQNGDSTTPGTFSASAAVNDATASRWGVLTYIGGVSYELQGKLAIGQTSQSVATQSYFVDSGKSILVVDTPHTNTDFSKILIDHSGSYFSLTNCSMVAGGTRNPGQLIFNNTQTVGDLNACTFDRIGITTLQLNVSASGTTWSRCGTITQNTASMDNCIFDGTRITSNAPDKITNSSFICRGDHAIEITQTGSYVFTGNTFLNFGPSGSLSASLYNNSGGVVSMSISLGDTPTYRNGTGASTYVSNPVIYTVNIVDADGAPVTSSCEVTIVKNSDTSILYAAENVITGTTQYLYTYTGDVASYINVLNVDIFEPKTVSNVTIGSTNQSITIQLDLERGKYVNP